MNRPKRAATRPDVFYGEQSDSSDDSVTDVSDTDDSEDEFICTVIKKRLRDPLDRAQEKNSEDAPTVLTFDKERGEDEWVGRRIARSFPGHGYFTGVVTKVKAWKRRSRLFHVVYKDGDEEDLCAKEVFECLLPANDVLDAKMLKSVTQNRYTKQKLYIYIIRYKTLACNVASFVLCMLSQRAASKCKKEQEKTTIVQVQEGYKKVTTLLPATDRQEKNIYRYG